MSAQRSCGIAHRADRLLAAAALGALLLVAPTQAQVAGGVLAEAARSRHPETRGEAALLLVLVAPEQAEATARAVAADRDRTARALGLLALGRLAPPGAEVVLGRAFEDARQRDLDRVAAAYAMALLPDEQPVPALDRYLARFDGGSYRRERDVLAAIAQGFAESPHPSRRAAMSRLLEDASNRDGRLRGLLVRALAAAGERPTDEQLSDRLDSAWVEVRLATVDALAADPAAASERGEELARAARADPDPRVRGRALRALAAARNTAAFAFVDDAVRTREFETMSAGIVATIELGGGARREALAASIAAEADPDRQAAMFAAWRGPVPDVLGEAAFRFAGDRRADATARALATHLLAREGDSRAVPLLRTLLAEAEEADTVQRVITDLGRLAADGDLSDRLQLTDSDSLRKLAPRLQALFSLKRPEAMELLQRAFADDRIGDGARAEILRAWRRAVLPAPPAEVLDALADGLAELLR